MKNILARALGVAFVLAIPAAAGIVFTSDFESDSLALNTTPAGWTVSNGTVDVVGPGFFGTVCGNGTRCVDMDGSTSNAGDMSRTFMATAGYSYLLSWDMNGNSRGAGDDTMTVSVGGTSKMYTLNANTALAGYSLNWVANASGLQTVMFSHAGGDNFGILLDNVVLTETASAIPEPSTWALMAGGAMAFFARRKFAK